MRRRLTYANVIATIALFFALTGGAWAAASKYLMASDPITQGDLAGSTYGNPVIATGKVTTGKITDGAVTTAKFDGSALAPNADLLDGVDSRWYVLRVAKGTVAYDFGQLPAGECGSHTTFAPSGADPATDYVLVNPVNQIRVTAASYLASVGGNTMITFTACNGDGAATGPGTATLRFVILRALNT